MFLIKLSLVLAYIIHKYIIPFLFNSCHLAPIPFVYSFISMSKFKSLSIFIYWYRIIDSYLKRQVI